LSEPLPAAVADGPLARGRGFVLSRGLFAPADLAWLRDDADASRPRARRNEARDVRAAEARGGAPARANTISTASAAQQRLLGSTALLRWLEQAVGAPVAPSGGGTYCWYERAGDFLGVHRDDVGCEVALVVCLSASPGRGGLVVHPDGVGRPLSSSAGPDVRSVPLPLDAGDAALLLGGHLPHQVLPMEEGQRRLVALACYRF
jgi:hypothetical protein